MTKRLSSRAKTGTTTFQASGPTKIWPVTDPSKDPLGGSHESIIKWIPPDVVPQDRVKVWTASVREAKQYIAHLTYGGPKLRAELKGIKLRLFKLREELFREFFPLAYDPSIGN